MRSVLAATLAGVVFLAAMPHGGAADCSCGHLSCTGSGDCPECVPACRATWGEAKTKKPKYSMQCEYACVRGRDP